MKAVFLLLCIVVAAVHQANAGCASSDSYTQEFIPECAAGDLYMKWPNYANMATYYKCVGIGSSVLVSCPSGMWFTYIFQECTDCYNYLPPVPCPELKTQNTPNCVPIGAYTTTSTIAPPASTQSTTTTSSGSSADTTTANAEETTIIGDSTISPSVPSEPTPPSGATVTPPTDSGSSVSGPPSVIVTDSDIPTPPAAAPTPPNDSVTPPSVA